MAKRKITLRKKHEIVQAYYRWKKEGVKDDQAIALMLDISLDMLTRIVSEDLNINSKTRTSPE